MIILGGTVDTAVHEVRDNNTVIEVFRACGGNWGGTAVDDEFRRYLERQYGEKAVSNFFLNAPLDALDFQRDYENQKRQISIDTGVELRIKIPSSLMTESIKVYAEATKQKDGGVHVGLPLQQYGVSSYNANIGESDIKKFFDPVVTFIKNHIEILLNKVTGIDLILLVGGFAESEYLREKLQAAFPEKRFVIPYNAGLSVLKGAVMFGFKPAAISARISRFTYGAGIMKPFDPTRHAPEKLRIIEGKEFCDDVFHILVREGELIEIDEKRGYREENRHRSPQMKQDKMLTSIHASKSTEPMYITDEGCQLVGQFERIPPNDGWPDVVEFQTDVYFGRTDITVFARASRDQMEFNHKFRLPYDN